MRATDGATSLDEYRIFETPQFRKDLEDIARGGRRDIERKLRETVYEDLRRHPHFGPNVRKLKGYDPETWRYRIGSWRFFFEIDELERVVFMIAASHRSTAY
jgi:mRNA interferase RelE/StbE